MTPFQLLFGRSQRTILDVLVPQMDDTETTGGLTNFIENRRHNMREVVGALKNIHEGRVKTRQRRSAEIRWPSSGVGSVEGDLVLERETESSLVRQGVGPKLVHEKWTGPWKIVQGRVHGIKCCHRDGRTKDTDEDGFHGVPSATL